MPENVAGTRNAADTAAAGDDGVPDHSEAVVPPPPAANWLGVEYRHYPAVYAVRLGLTLAAVWFVWPGYREFPLRITGLGLLVGLIGGGVWIGLCLLNLESRIAAVPGASWLLGEGGRAAFDPIHHLGHAPVWLILFLAVRLLGLVAVVPVIEEFFLRGFLLRCVRSPDDWWKLPVGTGGGVVFATAAMYGVLTHPAEMVAAAVWFSLITWLMVRTKSLWDCVAAHAVTNLILGVYVLSAGDWRLW